MALNLCWKETPLLLMLAVIERSDVAFAVSSLPLVQINLILL